MAEPVYPLREIVGFCQDEEQAWVAELICGHTQHVRHQPPWQLRPWVLTASGRHDRLGTMLGCPACNMRPLPAGLQEYKRTSLFDDESVPAGLLKNHRLKAGAWGEIVVVEGRVTYTIDHPELCIVLSPRLAGAVHPQVVHHIAPQPGARFFVRFLRLPRDD
jgi:tellurite resistance-related uncharacterized protein